MRVYRLSTAFVRVRLMHTPAFKPYKARKPRRSIILFFVRINRRNGRPMLERGWQQFKTLTGALKATRVFIETHGKLPNDVP